MGSATTTAMVLVLSGGALALPSMASAEVYLGGGYGMTESTDIDDRRVGDDTDEGWKAFLGAGVGRVFSWEIGYVDLGQLGGQGLPRLETKGWTADVLLGLPIGNLTLFGKVGAFLAETEFGPFDDENWERKYGAGVGFNISRNLGLRFEWERYELSDIPILDDTDIEMVSASLIFTSGAP
jgi:opacity protein-like surface antigen